jgi:hypothetical protein
MKMDWGKCVFLGYVAVMSVFGGVPYLWALNAAYNRPGPVMDYVSQEKGIYDTDYWELTETDCRRCHGESLTYRHHYSYVARQSGSCTRCHDIISDPPGVTVFRNCVVDEAQYGCHDWNNPVDIFNNGWHHNTDLATADNCVMCHDPNVVSPIGVFAALSDFPNQVSLPTPFSCENCHWGEERVAPLAGFNPDTSPPSHAGHPSTYNHFDDDGEFVGYYEYGRGINWIFESHHMGFRGDVSAGCDRCHGVDPNNPAWQYDDPQLIRYCEICHDPMALHAIASHTETTAGWISIGFHTSDNALDPHAYEALVEEDKCIGCHGTVPVDAPGASTCSPTIRLDASGMAPRFATDGTLITLSGSCFGPDDGFARSVQAKDTAGGGLWIQLPIHSWTDDSIQFEAQGLAPGNYYIRVRNPYGEFQYSNRVVLTYGGTNSQPLMIDPGSGPCAVWIRFLSADGCFGESQDRMLDGYRGQYYNIDFVSPLGKRFSAIKYRNWDSNSIEVRFFDFYEDKVDPGTGKRNYTQDDNEVTVSKCENLEHGMYTLYGTAVVFGDEDGSGDLSAADTILETSLASPLAFEFLDGPYILRLKTKALERGKRLRIIGVGFGLVQQDSEIRIGSKVQAENPATGKGKLLYKNCVWSHTRVAVKLKVPTKWQGKNKFVWIERNGFKSNSKRIKILPAQ